MRSLPLSVVEMAQKVLAEGHAIAAVLMADAAGEGSVRQVQLLMHGVHAVVGEEAVAVRAAEQAATGDQESQRFVLQVAPSSPTTAATAGAAHGAAQHVQRAAHAVTALGVGAAVVRAVAVGSACAVGAAGRG